MIMPYVGTLFVQLSSLKCLNMWMRDVCRGYGEGALCSELHASAHGLSRAQQEQRLCLYEENVIRVNVRPVLWLILHEVKFHIPLLRMGNPLNLKLIFN
jgi:hypothetical protein